MEQADPKRRRARRGGYRRPYRIAGGVLLVLTMSAAMLTFILVERWESAARAPSALDGANAGGGGISPFTATLYYVAADGRGLVRREIEVPYGADPLSRARIIAERQLEDAPWPLLSPFPEGTRLRAVYRTDDGTLFVDLSGEVTAEHTGGSLNELLTVYTLVNALATNVAGVDAVQILVDGREVDTLAGHIDLRQPLTPNLTWVVDLPRAAGEALPEAEAGGAPVDAGAEGNAEPPETETGGAPVDAGAEGGAERPATPAGDPPPRS